MFAGKRSSKELKYNLEVLAGRCKLYVRPDPEHPGFIKKAYWAESPSISGDLVNGTAEDMLRSGEERNIFGEIYILNQLEGSYFHQ